MKLYSYSSESQTIVEMKWVRAKSVGAGIVIAGILLCGTVMLNQSVDPVLGYRSATALAAENDVIRTELRLISPRVNKLEMQAGSLGEGISRYHTLLRRRKMFDDTVWSVTNVMNRVRTLSMNPTTASVRP